MKPKSHPIGSIPSRLRTMARSLGSTEAGIAQVLGMSHATLNRRLCDPEAFTLDEILNLLDVANKLGPTTYSLRLTSTGNRH